MSGSSTMIQALLPGKSAEALQRSGTQKKSDQSFADLFEKRMQIRQEQTTFSAAQSNRSDRQAAAERQNEARPLNKAEKAEKPDKPEKSMAKNPAKEKMKELMKKVKDTLEEMKDPEIVPERFKELADELKGLMVEIKALAKTLNEQTAGEPATEAALETPMTGIEGSAVVSSSESQSTAADVTSEKTGLKVGQSTEKLEAKSAEIHWDNRQKPEIKGNPILKDLEKVIEVQSDMLAENSDLKEALKQILTEVQAIQNLEATQPEKQAADKVGDLIEKLKGIVVKTPEVKTAESKAVSEESQDITVKTAKETDAVPVVRTTADSDVSGRQTDAEASDQQMSGQNQQGYNAQPATDSKDADKADKVSRAAETSAPAAEKTSQAAKQPTTQTPQTVQNPQAFQDTLDAIKDGVQAKGQFQNRVMEQVIESVKTNFKADDLKSEMIMKLKPESLGNVSLKVSIEKGVVMAEFQVDSQAVKQALESNLQDLRSALQDKGFNVFDLDVSVRKDNQNQQQSDNGRGYQTRTARLEGNLERIEQRLMSLEAVHHESTIDYLG